MGDLTLRETRCIVPPLPRPAAVDLVAAAMVVGVATAPMRPQIWFPHLSPSLVSEPTTTMAAVSAATPSAGSATAQAEVSATTPAAGSAEVPATSSGKVSVSEPPVVPAAVSVAASAERSTTASIGSVQALGPPPESGVAGRDKRLSLSRVVPAVTMKVAGRAVTYQEVVLVSSLSFVCGSPSKTAVLAAVVAAPAPLLPQTAYGAT